MIEAKKGASYITIQEDLYDTEVFGRKMGKVGECKFETRKIGREVLKEVLGRARNEDFVHITARMSLGEWVKIWVFEDEGFNLVDVIMIGYLELREPPPQPDIEVLEATEEDIPKMLKMFPTLFTTSRFFNDPFFTPEQAKKLHEKWIENAVRKKVADKVLVVKENKETVAFMACKVEKNIGKIPLYATAMGFQNLGLARELYKASMQWFWSKGIRKVEGQIVAYNAPSLNVAIRIGFRAAACLITLSKGLR